MKNLLLLFGFLLITLTVQSQSILELGPTQSMSITGKGPGQDAALNPYSKHNSVAIVDNIGKNDFEIRIQKKGEIVEIISISPDQSKEIDLLKGYELYFDSKKKAKARVDFRKKEDQ